ncbi:MAG TPA: sigma 54-interacting transcriptional regulator [Acidobacteriota bacterium]|jgi:Nif-specific regulatory protein|nr:sigma 54-interacting transcriptional regulator [Acidobacteriota bacterium]
MEDKTGEIRKLTTLLEVSQSLSGTLNLRAGLHRVLEILERHHGVIRSAVTLLHEESSELGIEASNGLSADGQRARYHLGEGITGRVVQSGKPIVVPQVSREPMFLNRAGERKDLNKQEVSFICVPVVINRKPAGTLGVDLRFKKDRDYDRELKFFRVVASMIAQAIKVHRLVDAERQRLLDENIHLREELRERYDFSNIIGNSGPMRQVYEQVAQVAQTNTTVLIRGESGTGKELIAHAIHYNSPRAKKPFVKVSCAALPDTLIESELFGYEKGAFTGAQNRKKGRFEMAEGGTLFLDEIGDLNLSTQVKLLRSLQEREFERLGGNETIRVNVRLIAATNKDLEKAIAAETFREDLYYRLNVFAIFVPPLRERKPDVMLLADYFLEKYSVEHGKNIKRISTPAIDMLMSYHWPGNVRELENTIERGVLVCDGNVVHGHHLPPTLQTAEASGTVMSASLTEAIDAYEKDLIQDALKTTRGNRSKAAKLLSSTERIINYKVKKYAIDAQRFRS